MPNQHRPGIDHALEVAGVDTTARGQPLLPGIQLVYKLDDLSGFLPPLRRPTFFSSQSSPISAFLFGVIELSPPPDSAIVVPYFRNDNAVRFFWGIGTVTGIADDLSVITPGASVGGETARADFRMGTGSGPRTILRAPSSDVPPNFPALVIPPGRKLLFSTDVVNDAVDLTIAWYEIPIAAATSA